MPHTLSAKELEKQIIQTWHTKVKKLNMSKHIISQKLAEHTVANIVTDETVDVVGLDSYLLKRIGSLPIYEIKGGILYVDGSMSSFVVQINAYTGDLVGCKYSKHRRPPLNSED